MAYTGITGTTQGAGPNFDQGVICGANLDLSGVLPAGQVGNCFSRDGQLWIGSTALTAGGTHAMIGNITGSGGVTVTNGPGSINIAGTGPATDLHTARFIVASSTSGTGANYTTIAAAIAAAQGTGINSTIFIQPGTYTENFTLPANINLSAFTCDYKTPNVTIVGKITCTDAGVRSISGIRLQTNSDFFLAVTGTLATDIRLINCYLNCTNNTGISFTTSSASATIECICCDGNLATTGIGYFSHSSAGILQMRFGVLANTGSSLTASTASAGMLYFEYMRFLAAITTSSTCVLDLYYSNIATSALNITALTHGGATASIATRCEFFGGTATAVSVSTTLKLDNCSINSTNAAALAGAGTISSGGLTFTNSSTTNTATTQTPIVTSNDALNVVTPGAYPYTTVPQDALILVDTSSARTITPLASPTTGQRHIIKDNVGSASTNNITVTPSGKNIDGAASSTINIAYGSITIVFGGTEWSII